MPEERIYVIPLKKVKKTKRYRRSSRAAKLVREFLQRHMKTERVRLNEELNRELWKRGAERPLSRIRVRVVKQDDGSAEAFLVGTQPKEEG